MNRTNNVTSVEYPKRQTIAQNEVHNCYLFPRGQKELFSKGEDWMFLMGGEAWVQAMGQYPPLPKKNEGTGY